MLHQRVLIKGLVHFLFILILPKLNLGSWEDHTFNTEEILKCKQEWLKLLRLVIELFSSCPLASPFILIEILQTARCHVKDETIEWIENKNDQVWVLLHSKDQWLYPFFCIKSIFIISVQLLIRKIIEYSKSTLNMYFFFSYKWWVLSCI